MKYYLPVLLMLGAISHIHAQSPGKWISLFNGKNLDGWVVKISGYETGENFADTYRVNRGVIETSYEGYGDDFKNRFGLLFYKKPFSHYRLKMKYRFFGEQAPGIASWAWRNSGVMIHSQSPESMPRDQDFPISLEVQFLGGDGTNERPTGNLCTPGTHVEMEGKLEEEHCIAAKAKTYHGNRWVKAEVLVLGDSLIQHIFGGKSVISYSKPVIGGEVVNNYDPKVKVDGTPIRSGYIALQSESHPIAFKAIKIKELDTNGKPLKAKK